MTSSTSGTSSLATSTAAALLTSLSTSSSAVPSGSTSSSSSSNLSTGAKPGIGIGAGVGALAVVGFSALLLIRARRDMREASTKRSTESESVDLENEKDRIPEMNTTYNTHELDILQAVALGASQL